MKINCDKKNFGRSYKVSMQYFRYHDKILEYQKFLINIIFLNYKNFVNRICFFFMFLVLKTSLFLKAIAKTNFRSACFKYHNYRTTKYIY